MNRIVPYPHPFIAREGWPFIAGGLLLALLVTGWDGWASVPLWLLLVFVVQFFRDPPRALPERVAGSGRKTIAISPADGRIVAVQSCTDPYHEDRPALKISVFMNVFNVHSNRSPLDGTVLHTHYFPGAFFNAALDKASLQNERNAVVLRTEGEHDGEGGHIVTFVQVAGLVARRIRCYAKTGDVLHRGQRYGFIRFGSRVDVYLPPASRPLVALGDKVSATSTALAELPAQSSAINPPVPMTHDRMPP